MSQRYLSKVRSQVVELARAGTASSAVYPRVLTPLCLVAGDGARQFARRAVSTRAARPGHRVPMF